MKFIAIQPCPQGQAPGEEFEATEDAGNILVLHGIARKADPDADPVALPEKPRGRYRRSDLRVDDHSLTSEE